MAQKGYLVFVSKIKFKNYNANAAVTMENIVFFLILIIMSNSFLGALNIPEDLPAYMEMAIRTFNEYILNFQDCMADAQNEVQSMASLWYAICNQEKEKRARVINKLAKYGQKLAHLTRTNTVLAYKKQHRNRSTRKGLLITRAKPSFISADIEDLATPKTRRRNILNRKGGAVLISPQPLRGGKTNRTVQINTANRGNTEANKEKDRTGSIVEVSARNSGDIPERQRSGGNVQGNKEKERTQSVVEESTTNAGGIPKRQRSLGNAAANKEKERRESHKEGSTWNARAILKRQRSLGNAAANKEKERRQTHEERSAQNAGGIPERQTSQGTCLVTQDTIPDETQVPRLEQNIQRSRILGATGQQQRGAEPDGGNEENTERCVTAIREQYINERPIQERERTVLNKEILKRQCTVYPDTTPERQTSREAHETQRDASKKQSITTLPNKIQRTGTETNPERERIVVSTGQEDRSVENANRDVPADTTNQHGIQVEWHEHQQRSQIGSEIILNKQPVIVLKEISSKKIQVRSRKQKERTEESVEKNGTIPQDGNTYLQQPEEEETNYSADCASFTEELAELDVEGSRKAKSKAKQARTGNLYQQEVQE